MKSAYTIKEAQKNLSAVIRQAERGSLATITRHHKPVVHIISAARLSAIAETMEILADPAAMKAIRDAESGKAKTSPLIAATAGPQSSSTAPNRKQSCRVYLCGCGNESYRRRAYRVAASR
jgi:prevent-host-death family protein